MPIGCEPACKPSFVIEGNHLSCRTIAGPVLPPVGIERRASAALSCFPVGVAPDRVCRASCSLNTDAVPRAPVSSYLAFPPLPSIAWRYISVALSLRSPSAAVSRYPALWGSDFPHGISSARLPSRLTCLFYRILAGMSSFFPSPLPPNGPNGRRHLPNAFADKRLTGAILTATTSLPKIHTIFFTLSLYICKVFNFLFAGRLFSK